ncbi:MAG TPA: PQQ-binding-like beta-propeller repeat protein [Bryobacteraceae bacterium]|nr:PQQ-binding-like beta-propeller repeat protein [Bryobacteraceae bacterium]
MYCLRRHAMRPTIAIGAVLCVSALWAQVPATDWRDYLGAPDSSHYSPLKQIDAKNAGKLQVAWSFSTQGTYTFAPLVVDNVAYVLGEGGDIVALDAATGKEIWTHAFPRGAGGGGLGGRRGGAGAAGAGAEGRGGPGGEAAAAGAQGRGAANPAARFGGGAGGARGLNYWQSKDGTDRRIILAVSNQLQEIDARTGKQIETFGDKGFVDLREGLGRDPSTVRQAQSRTPGRVFENLIILGSSPGEAYISPPGFIRAYDVLTGKLAWTFHTVPQPGEPGYDTWPKDAYKYIGGVNTWGEISLDEKRGIAYFPLGSPTYDFYGADRIGDGLYGNCLLALDARTGKQLWHFQMVHHDLWDYDAAAAPQLITVKHDGKTVDAVAQATKQGFLFVFDRVTGKPLWPIEERKTPGSDIPGESPSPTQPFPTAPPPHGRQSFTVADIDPYYITDEERAAFKKRLEADRNTGLFTPAGFVETVEMPGNNGGSIYFTTAADPEHGMAYVVTKNAPSLIQLTDNPRGANAPAGRGRGNAAGGNAANEAAANVMGGRAGAATAPERQGRAIYEQNCQLCHGADLKGNGSAAKLDDIVARLGQQHVRDIVGRGEGDMPSFSNMPDASMNALLAFLTNPSAAPPGSAAAVAAPAFGETPYPEGVEHPPARYYTGYGYVTLDISPPWSTLTEYDLNKGTIKWQVPFGDNPAAGPNLGQENRGNLWPKSGVAVTASGLVLFASNEGKLRILDANTGKEIANYNLPNGSQCVPAVYEVNGREYVLINATGPASDLRIASNGTPPPNVSKSYVAFALPSAK